MPEPSVDFINENKFVKVEEIDSETPHEARVTVDKNLSWVEQSVWNPWKVIAKYLHSFGEAQEISTEHVEQREFDDDEESEAGRSVEVSEERVTEHVKPDFCDIPLQDYSAKEIPSTDQPANQGANRTFGQVGMPRSFV